MKKPEEYFTPGEWGEGDFNYYDILSLIEEVQKESYNEGLRDAANHAKLNLGEERGVVDEYNVTDELGYDFGITVDQESILKLKK